MPPEQVEKKEKIVTVEVLQYDKYVKVPESRAKSLIIWTLYVKDKWISGDKKHYIRWSSALEKFVLIEKQNVVNSEQDSSSKKTKFVWKMVEDKVLCSDCLQIYNIEDLIFLSRNHHLCKDCLKNTEKCQFCNIVCHSTEIQNFNTYDGQVHACKECTKEKYNSCNRCGCYHLKSDSYRHNNRVYCCSCYSDYFVPCAVCGCKFFKNDMRKQNNRYYCGPCYENKLTIKEYNYTPKQFKFHKLEWDNKLCMGIEMEIETNKPRDNDESYAKLIMDYIAKLGLKDLFYIKHDGTVQGFELVSHPATLNYLHKNVPWYQMMKWFREQGFSSYKSGNCGLHIHLNKQFFNPLEIHKLRLFFSTNKPFIYKFSKRFGFNDRYCKFENFSPGNFIKFAQKQEDKYWALRTKPQKTNTVEMRVFRGTLSYPRFIATLQFADALAHYVKHVSIVSCQEKTSWVHFIQWCHKETTYGHFIKYIKNNMELEKTEV